MPQVISPKTKIVTKDGECHITISLELTINLNTNGLALPTSSPNEEIKPKSLAVAEDKVDLMVPEFESIGKFKFGK